MHGTLDTAGNSGTNVFVTGDKSVAHLNGVLLGNDGEPPIYGAVAHNGGFLQGSNIQYSPSKPMTCAFVADSGVVDVSRSTVHCPTDASSVFCSFGQDGEVHAEDITATADDSFVAFLTGAKTATFTSCGLMAGGDAVLLATNIVEKPSSGRLQLALVDSHLSQTTPGKTVLLLSSIVADVQLWNTKLTAADGGFVLSSICGVASSPSISTSQDCTPSDIFVTVSESNLEGNLLVEGSHILWSFHRWSSWKGLIDSAGPTRPANVDVNLDTTSRWELTNETWVQSIVTPHTDLSNIKSSFNLYYNASNPKNDYLQAKEYALDGGGVAKPYHIPPTIVEVAPTADTSADRDDAAQPSAENSGDASTGAQTSISPPSIAQRGDGFADDTLAAAPAEPLWAESGEDAATETVPADVPIGTASDDTMNDDSCASEAVSPEFGSDEASSTGADDDGNGVLMGVDPLGLPALDLLPATNIYPRRQESESSFTADTNEAWQSSDGDAPSSNTILGATPDTVPTVVAAPPTTPPLLASFPWPFTMNDRYGFTVVSAQLETFTDEGWNTTAKFTYSFNGTERSSEWAFDKDGVLLISSFDDEPTQAMVDAPAIIYRRSSSQIVLTAEGKLVAAEINRELMPIPGGDSAIQDFTAPSFQDKKLCGCTILNNGLYCLCPLVQEEQQALEDEQKKPEETEDQKQPGEEEEGQRESDGEEEQKEPERDASPKQQEES